MTKQPPRRIPPFALEILAHHPLAMTLPAAGFGMLCRLVFHFILTNCRPIPKLSDDLCGIMRAHRPTFNTHRADIMAIFNDLAPQLIAADRLHQQRRAAVTAAGEAGRAAQRLRALANKPTRPPADAALTVTAPKRERTNPTPQPFTNPNSAWRE
jgi:hypothetical protein